MSSRIPIMVGVEGSPYSRNLRALFRYGRMPFAWVRPGSREAERVECLIDGQTWEQKPFPYQRKCLQVLRERHAALRHEDREVADTVLEEAGFARLFAA